MPKKVYYSRVAGSSYYDRKGTAHVFAGGALATEDPDLQEELDAIIAQGSNPLIRADKQASANSDEARAAAEVAENAAAAAALNAGVPATQGAGIASSASGNAAASNSK
jgi:hypothetical protein